MYYCSSRQCHRIAFEILPSTGTNHAVHNSNFCLDGALAGRDKLDVVCRSHGEKMKDMMEELRYDRYQQTDYVLCAVLLRLADILDFDVSRTPHVLHEFQKISTSGDITNSVGVIFGWLSVKLLWNI